MNTVIETNHGNQTSVKGHLSKVADNLDIKLCLIIENAELAKHELKNFVYRKKCC